MRTAEEIIKSKGRLRRMCDPTKLAIKNAIDEARTEAIKECAETAYKREFEAGRSFDKQSILNLIEKIT